jgi:hypothetical protein
MLNSSLSRMARTSPGPASQATAKAGMRERLRCLFSFGDAIIRGFAGQSLEANSFRSRVSRLTEPSEIFQAWTVPGAEEAGAGVEG